MSYEEHVITCGNNLPVLTSLLGEDFMRDWQRPFDVDFCNLDFPCFPAPTIKQPVESARLPKPTYTKPPALPIGFKFSKSKKLPKPLNDRPGGSYKSKKKASKSRNLMKKKRVVPRVENCD